MQLKARSLKQYLGLTLRGAAMGAADVVPGVSGGTIAFITGIYDELLYSLRQVTPRALWVWKCSGFKAAWAHINGGFLLALFSGVLLSLFTFAKVITWALEQYPIIVWAFFFGLVVASIAYFAKQQSGWRALQWIGLVVGTLSVYWVSIATPAQLPGANWMLFLGGFIAICAMILPGISGSFLLLLMGLYPVFLRAITQFDVVALACFGVGCIAGLLLFSRVLSWLLEYHKATTMAVLIGFLLGSLNVIWPWKLVLKTTVDRHGEVIPLVQKAVLPYQFIEQTGQSAMLFSALAAAALGVFVVLFAEIFGERLVDKP